MFESPACYMHGAPVLFFLFLNDDSRSVFHFLAGFTRIGVGAAYYGLRPVVEFMTFNFSMQCLFPPESFFLESVVATVGPGSSSNNMPTLKEYGTNLTDIAEEAALESRNEEERLGVAEEFKVEERIDLENTNNCHDPKTLGRA